MTETLELGLCHCGCGNKAPIAKQTNKVLGHVAGQPVRYISGHNSYFNALPRPPIRFGEVEGEPVAYLPLTQGFETIVDSSETKLFPLHLYYRKGYAQVTIGGLSLRLHALIFNAPNGLEPDHENRNSLDNRLSNLRPATREQNTYNQGPRKDHPTGYKGVTLLPSGKYRSRIRVGGKQENLGLHGESVSAAIAYDKAAVRLCGEYAYLNFPELREKWLLEGINGD